MNAQIAITAMAGVFPGPDGPAPLEQFITNVACARRATLRSVEAKWGISRDVYFHPEPGVPYRTYLDSAYTITEDPPVPPLVVGKRVLRDLFATVAGTAMPAGSRTGICVAMMWTDLGYYFEDWRRVLGQDFAPEGIAGGAFDPGQQNAALAEAVGISGPVMAMDAACASSLYALDAAIGLIETGRADAIAVMGLNAYMPLFMFLGFSKLRALSPKAEILPFSADASGLIPAEAVAAILVEPLEQALHAGRKPLAVIRSLGLSADGGDRSVFAPSPAGQYLAYERAYRNVDPASVEYVEAHGTATVLGDQTEIEALDRFFAPHRKQRKLPIGSVKALVGHTLPTAGLASIIKTIFMLREGVIAPHIKVRPNPRLADSCLCLPSETHAWPESTGARRSGISAFGFGGNNAHLVLEAFSPNAGISAAPLRRIFPAVAIVAMEASMGSAHGCLEAAKRLESPNPTWTSPPWRRFSMDLPAGQSDTSDGNFFPDALDVEAAGLRMGPKALARTDAFQRLGVDLARRVLDAQTNRAPLDETAAVFCSNLGGDISLQMARHYQAKLTGHHGGLAEREEPGFESIASSLSSLLSGFVSFHHRIKGFHETLSGGSSSFWESLALAPYWLGDRSRALVLAAGRYVRSPIDLDSSRKPGEGLVVFLLKTLEECEKCGETPLAVVRFADAGDAFEVSQLDPAADLRNRGAAQQAFGFIDEATGAESLLRVLLTKGTGKRAIEIRNGNPVWDRVVVDKIREFEFRPIAFSQPVKVEFQPPPPEPARPHSVSAARFLDWQRTTESALLAYFDAQRGLLDAAYARPPQLLPKIRRDEKNVVLVQPRGEAGGASATLKVDETHSYFFDHALDHVPGILILEGILQLVELLMPATHYVSGIDLSFKRFCEKDQPTRIRVIHAGPERYSVEVSQDGNEAARCEVEIARIPLVSASRPAVIGDRRDIPDPIFLHKSDAQNVLVTTIQDVIPGKHCRCDLLPPRAGHILDEGPELTYSLLYIFETSRQFVMLIAHQLEKVPLGLPINLVSIQLQLDRPAPRSETLHFECERQPVRKIGQMILADLKVDLVGSGGRIGESVIRAQVVDQATYRKQRGRA